MTKETQEKGLAKVEADVKTIAEPVNGIKALDSQRAFVKDLAAQLLFGTKKHDELEENRRIELAQWLDGICEERFKHGFNPLRVTEASQLIVELKGQSALKLRNAGQRLLPSASARRCSRFRGSD